MKIVNPDYSVEKIVQRMKDAAAHAALVSEAPLRSPTAFSDDPESRLGMQSDLDIHPITFQEPFHPRSDDHYHVDDLLRFSDRHFVVSAYRAILKRAPDEAGFNGFIEALRSGELNKIDVLGRLRFSKEGREKNVHIDGLRWPLRLRKLYRLPVIGYFINLLVAIARLPAMIRNERQFESHALVQQEALASQVNHLGNILITHAERMRTSLELLNRQLEQLSAEQTSTGEVILDRVASLNRYFEERVNDEAAERQSEFALLRNYYDEELSVARSRAAIEALDVVSGLSEQVNNLQDKNQQITSELILQGHRLTRMLERPQEVSLPSSEDHPPQLRTAAQPHLLDAFYASFDEKFRGHSEEIKDRLRVYLPFLANVSHSETILDVGCGRGEWLELLSENGWRATGVDANGVLIDQCRTKGLHVVQSDLISYLNALSDDSVGAVSAFHVVEHLPLDILVRFLNETMRVLKAGGVVLLETPNPRNVLVGSCNFYFDPTHQNPIPSEVLQFLMDSRGFSRTKVLPLNPSDEMPVEGESDLVVRFNRYFYGPMDYGLVGWKPARGDSHEQ